MNEEFSQSVRESAFSLSLSHKQIQYLHIIATQGPLGVCQMKGSPNMATIRVLKRKGLYAKTDKEWGITEEDRIVHQLLMRAGYFKEEECEQKQSA